MIEIINAIHACKTMEELDKERSNIINYIDKWCDEKSAITIQKEFVKQKNKLKYGRKTHQMH